MQLFQFDRAAARAAFARDGFVHVRDGVTPAFLARATEVVHRALADTPEAVGGNVVNKEQFRFDFDDPHAAQQEVFDAFGHVGGRDPSTLTLSERHVNAYRVSAEPDPIPHKDRRASQLTIGVSIEVPEGSHLVLYPGLERDENPYDSAAELLARLPAGARPQQALRGAPEVVLFDRPGDVVLFAGSTTWHCRRRAAGTVNLFCKLNDFGDDPLGEDVRHALAGAPAGSAATG